MSELILAYTGTRPYEKTIGIGITTFNRPDHLELCKQQLQKFLGSKNPLFNYRCYVADDSTGERLGIAKRKNECLSYLKNCDYIFLFDDDTLPIKAGWTDFFIEASKASGQQHMMYLKETPTIKQTGRKVFYNSSNWDNKHLVATGPSSATVDIYNNSAGCMMFFTKECIEKVGGYNPNYGIYGFEHSGLSNRIHKAGLTPLGAYTCPAGAGEYIYAMDLDHHLPFNKQLRHEPSLKNELHLLNDYLKKNKAVYDLDTEIYQAL